MLVGGRRICNEGCSLQYGRAFFEDRHFADPVVHEQACYIGYEFGESRWCYECEQDTEQPGIDRNVDGDKREVTDRLFAARGFCRSKGEMAVQKIAKNCRNQLATNVGKNILASKDMA